MNKVTAQALSNLSMITPFSDYVVHTAVQKPVCSTGVQKTSLQYSCTQNQFTEQMYTIQLSVQFKFLKLVVSKLVAH